MSDVASSPPGAASVGAFPGLEGGNGSDPTGEHALEPIERDDAATHIRYEPHSKVPWALVAFWATALLGLAIYTVAYLLPDLARWGRP